MNPIDDALEFLEEGGLLNKEAFASRRKPTPLGATAQKELEMWKQWQSSGKKPEHLRPLVKSLQPLVKHRSRVFEGRVRDIPPAVIQAEFQKQLVGALETFDPNKGKMGTWVTNRLMKANRFINTYQNPARIVETRIGGITDLHNAEDALKQQLGRTPTSHEIADRMKWPVKEVRTLQTEVRKAYPTGYYGPADPTSITPSRTKEVMKLLPYDLTPDENAVFEHVYGIGGKKPMGTNQIAGKLNMSAPKVSRLKKAIADKWRKYGG
jgi:DNA-directed RNA polymerase specialized sigma subunit